MKDFFQGLRWWERLLRVKVSRLKRIRLADGTYVWTENR